MCTSSLTGALRTGGGFRRESAATTTEIGPAIFRHQDPPDGRQIAVLYYLPLNHSREEIREAPELIRRNGLRSCLHTARLDLPWIRRDGPLARSAPVDVIVAVWPWGAYLGEEGKKTESAPGSASWRRISPAGLIPHAKAVGST
jgi:branched-chain amino acid aminotransferase